MIHLENGVIRYSYNDISVWFIALLSLFQWSLREIFRFTPMIKIDFVNCRFSMIFPNKTNPLIHWSIDCCKTHGHPSIFHRFHRPGPATAAPARRGAATELRAVRRDAQCFFGCGEIYQHHLPDIYQWDIYTSCIFSMAFLPTSFTIRYLLHTDFLGICGDFFQITRNVWNFLTLC